jgi:neutral ceramidase
MKWLLLAFAFLSVLGSVLSQYQIGTGIYDITGPVAEVRFFGYADLLQTGKGLHFRLRSRAYYIEDPTSETVVLVVTDLWAISSHIKQAVLARLQEAVPGVFTFDNLMIGCTHTHSGPGGYDDDFLFNLPAFGFYEESFEVIINGIVQSVLIARDNRQSGQILINKGNIEGVAVNRSPPPYMNNPAAERAQYNSDVDKEMTVLKFVGDDGTELGMIGFHGVHPVSMKRDNRLVSGDNKGYAAVLFEKSKGTNYQLRKNFAASFPIANAGDVSPNTGGTLETGELIGEGKDYIESTLISATRMFDQAKAIYDAAGEKISGSIDFRFTNVDMSNVYVEAVNASTVAAALGYSFTAGTADGIAFGMEYQGQTEVIPVLERVSKIFANYSDEFQAAHGNKPILIPAGLTRPGPMVPQILSLQLIRIGQFALIAFPSEITTMAGRRIKKTILDNLSQIGVRHVAISALTNGYAQYVTTKEEYDIQWYEGASTYFGPYTLLAYQQEFNKLADAIRTGASVPVGAELPSRTVHEILPPHRHDDEPDGYSFGDVLTDVLPSYTKGETASVTFVGANPRSDLKTQETFLEVEFQQGITWAVVATDSDWETKFHWEKTARTTSTVTIEWTIPTTVANGTYRIRYLGNNKNRLTGRVASFQGVSSTFTVS